MNYPYHINPETNRANKCYKVDNCRFGIPAEAHYDTREEAVAAIKERSDTAAALESVAPQSVAADTESKESQKPRRRSASSSPSTPGEEAQTHDAKLSKLFEEQTEQRAFAINNLRTLAHRLGINLKKRIDPEKVLARADAAVNSENPVVLSPYLERARENLAAVESIQEQISEIDKAYAGWNRYFKVPGGRIHSNVNCRTCNHSWEHPTQFEWLYGLSGKDPKDAVEEYGAVLCTVCFPDAPVEWTDYFDRLVSEKKKTRCPGSGTWDYDLETARLGHATGNYGVCEHCGQRITITSTGKLRAHRLPVKGKDGTTPEGTDSPEMEPADDEEAARPRKRRGRPKGSRTKVNA